MYCEKKLNEWNNIFKCNINNNNNNKMNEINEINININKCHLKTLLLINNKENNNETQYLNYINTNLKKY